MAAQYKVTTNAYTNQYKGTQTTLKNAITVPMVPYVLKKYTIAFRKFGSRYGLSHVMLYPKSLEEGGGYRIFIKDVDDLQLQTMNTNQKVKVLNDIPCYATCSLLEGETVTLAGTITPYEYSNKPEMQWWHVNVSKIDSIMQIQGTSLSLKFAPLPPPRS